MASKNKVTIEITEDGWKKTVEVCGLKVVHEMVRDDTGFRATSKGSVEDKLLKHGLDEQTAETLGSEDVIDIAFALADL